MREAIPAWVNWIAQDADGTGWGYEHEPNPADHGWYENEVGRRLRLGADEPNAAWRESLASTVERPPTTSSLFA